MSVHFSMFFGERTSMLLSMAEATLCLICEAQGAAGCRMRALLRYLHDIVGLGSPTLPGN